MSGWRIPGCRDDWDGLGQHSPFPVLSAADPDFYWPQNWPGNKAPCEWRLDSGGGYVSLWIEYADEPGVRYHEWISARTVEEAIKADRELTDLRDRELQALAQNRAFPFPVSVDTEKNDG